MKKKIICTALALLCIFMLPQSAWAAQLLVPGGQVIGLSLEDQTVTVAAFDEILGAEAKNAGLRVGDRITCVDGIPVRSASDVHQALRCSDGVITVSVLREGKAKQLRLHPRATADGPRLGVYLKEGVTGIGTVTWYDPEKGSFGALGHGVNTGNGELIAMYQGQAYDATVLSVKKGKIGEPGQLIGALTGQQPIGELKKNTVRGVFGSLDKQLPGEPLPVAEASEIRTGAATIRSTVNDSQLREYSVEILKIYPNAPAGGRNLLLKVTDPALLNATGGIVQGMSGSPIIQDGKLIGAVTHVLVNDPTTGYGIFIENMLDAAA